MCILTLIEEKIKKALNLDFFTMLKYQNTKIFLQKVTFQIGLKKSLWLKKSKILCRGLNGGEVVWTFHEKELQKTNQKV